MDYIHLTLRHWKLLFGVDPAMAILATIALQLPSVIESSKTSILSLHFQLTVVASFSVEPSTSPFDWQWRNICFIFVHRTCCYDACASAEGLEVGVRGDTLHGDGTAL